MKEYQNIDSLLAFDTQRKKFLPRFASPLVDYLSRLPWIAYEEIDGDIIRVHWDGHKVEWAGRTDKTEIPSAVDDLIHDKFDDTEIVFEQRFGEKDVYLFMKAYGGKIRDGAYGGRERLIGIDVSIDDVYLDKQIIKQVFDAFDIKTVDFFQIPNLQEAVNAMSQAQGASRYNIKGATTGIEGLVCTPLVRLYDFKGNLIITRIKKKDLENVYDPNTPQAPQPAPNTEKEVKGKKSNKKAN